MQHPGEGSGWGAIRNVYVTADGKVLGHGGGGGYVARVETINEAVTPLVRELEGVSIFRPQPGSGWGGITAVYRDADGTILATENEDGDFFTRKAGREAVAKSLGLETLPGLSGARSPVTSPPAGGVAATSEYNARDWTYVEGRNVWVYEPAGEPANRPPEALPQGTEQGGQWTYHADREHWYYEPPVAALPTGTDGGGSVVGERPYNARDWTYVEGRNVWVYEPAGEPADRPPEALPQGAEQGGQWTYHADREHWYYEPPVADAGVEAAPAQPSGSADAATGETGADSDLTDTEQEVANHVAQFLAGGGVLTDDQRQRLVEMGILEPGADAATGDTAADAGAGAAQVQPSGSADAATGETGADSDLTDTEQEVANHVRAIPGRGWRPH